MENKNSKINKWLIFVIILLLILIAYLLVVKANVPIIIEDKVVKVDNTIQILGNKDDLVAFSVAPNTKVSGLVSYRGVVKGAYFFEANILINILDSDMKVLKKSNAMATSDWMTVEPVNFEGNIDFTGLKKGPAYIEIQNDDPSAGEGGPNNPAKKIQIPIIIE